MDRVWQSAPAAALCVHPDAQGLQVQTNVAAARLAERQGLGAADWQALAAQWWPADAPESGRAELGAQRLAVDVQRVPMDAGRVLLWLLPDPIDERLNAARRATEFLDRALVLAGISVWRLDQRTQRFHFNAVGFRVTGMGYDATGIPVDAMRDTIHPDDREAIVRGAEEAMASDRVVDVVARYRNPDGSWRTLLTRRVAERDDDGRVIGLAGVSLDLTEQMAERRRAEALDERTRLVAETIGVGFWSRDLDAGTAHWDEQMYRIHRRPPALGPPGFDDWIGDHVHPQDRAWMTELHRRASAAWEPVVDSTFRVADGDDGGERWVQTWTRRLVRDGRRLAFGMHLDVTDRQRQHALLQRERARTQFAIDAAEVGVWERSLDGDAAYWNDAMYRLRGLQPDDPRPINDLAVVCAHPEDLQALNRLVERHLDDGTPYRIEFRVHAPGGGWRWLVTQGRALRDGDGRIVGMAGINLDITERKQGDALRQQKERAEQASRDQSQFLARVSHELRTPMNAVLGFTQLLDDDPADPPTPRQRARLQRIAEAGAKMMLLVDDLLDLASLEAGPPATPAEGVPLADAARQALDGLAGLAQQHGVTLRAADLAAAGSVRADRRRLVQLVSHLAGHAVRRQRRGGWVELGGHLDTDGERPMACLAVRADGPGYSDSEAARLFEPFPRESSGNGGGEGIGLALVWRLAQALGGSLQIDSPPAGGTELLLRLPADAAGAAAPAAQPPLAPAATQPLHVLCVEDNPVNLLLVRELLALRPSVRLRAAVDGLSGISMALAEPPDVLLLDLQLPDIAGLEVLRRLRAEPKMAACVFVALSANAMPDHIANARAAGFHDYWTKPIDFERFLANIDRLAARPASGG